MDPSLSWTLRLSRRHWRDTSLTMRRNGSTLEREPQTFYTGTLELIRFSCAHILQLPYAVENTVNKDSDRDRISSVYEYVFPAHPRPSNYTRAYTPAVVRY